LLIPSPPSTALFTLSLHDALPISSQLPMAGIVAAGNPIEPIPQTELVDVPPSMARGGENFALRVKGESMRDEGILPGDLVIVHKDRKSTRLNSSHEWISYAVFCLK